MTAGLVPAVNSINPNTGKAPEFRIPQENEWVKAAYYTTNYNNTGNPGYWLICTQSDAIPGNVEGSLPNQVNVINTQGNLCRTQLPSAYANTTYVTPNGAFSSSASYYGTYGEYSAYTILLFH
jgi:hypothetical protein